MGRECSARKDSTDPDPSKFEKFFPSRLVTMLSRRPGESSKASAKGELFCHLLIDGEDGRIELTATLLPSLFPPQLLKPRSLLPPPCPPPNQAQTMNSLPEDP